MAEPTVNDVLTLLADWLEADFEYGNNLYPDREDELSRRYEAADAAVRELDVDHLRTLIDPAGTEALRVMTEDRDRLKEACISQAKYIEQVLGRALGFPEIQDCPEIGGQPGDTDVVVFHYVAEDLADLVVKRFKKLGEFRDGIRKMAEENSGRTMYDPRGHHFLTPQAIADTLDEIIAPTVAPKEK